MTAYAVPPTFAHGDYPLAAELNKIRDGQLYFYETLPTYGPRPCVREVGTGEQVTFTHRHRWLHYKSTGTIIDPAGIEPDIDLSNPSDSWVNVYDLDSIAWLAYGALYYVEGVTFASEELTE